jgi:hypothetical protein
MEKKEFINIFRPLMYICIVIIILLSIYWIIVFLEKINFTISALIIFAVLVLLILGYVTRKELNK